MIKKDKRDRIYQFLLKTIILELLQRMSKLFYEFVCIRFKISCK